MSNTKAFKEYFQQQPEIYGFRIASFVSFSGDSIFYVTPTRVKLDNRLLAVFSRVRRTMGYEPMLGLTPEQYLQFGWAKIDTDLDGEIEWLISAKRKKGYSSISYVEF